MHYFFKPKTEQSLKIDLTENEQTKGEQKQIQKEPLRKIIVKKKIKKSLQDISDNIVQTQSQHFVEGQSQKNKKTDEVSQDREIKKKQKPFISFMPSQNQSYQELQTPYLHGPSPSYNFDSIKMNIETVPIEEVEDVEQRMIARTKSKPIQQIPLQSPLNRNLGSLMRRNSLKSQFQTFKKGLNQYPGEISSQKNDYSSMYEKSKQGSRPRLTLKQNKEEKISVLEDDFSENIDSVEFKQPKSTQSTKFLLRRDNQGGDNDEISYVNNKGRMGRRSMNPNGNHFQSKLSAAIQSSQSESQSQKPQQLTSRIEVPIETYIISKSSGYSSYIELQSRQLEQQQKRMNFYSEEANKLLCNVESYQSPIQDELVIDKHYYPLKYMMEELVELFCMGQIIKYQLRYRSFEILNKVYAKASQYYQQKIVIEDPIKAYTFSLALKALLPQYEKSQLDIVIAKIFHSHHLLSFENFSQQLQPILNSKLVSLLQPQSMKKELDKTLQKAKNLFVIWIEIQYFTKKIREILRASKIVYDSIILECTSIEQPLRLDMQLLQKYFLQGQKKNSIKKLKLDVFFRNIIGNDLLKSNWTDWVYKQEVRLYNRYQGKAIFERLHYQGRPDRRQTYMKGNLNSRKNDIQQTSIMDTSRKIISHRRNF